MTRLHKIFVPSSFERTGTVIFIHGLEGNLDTWGLEADDPPSFWPKWVADDLASVAVYCLVYPASRSNWRGHAMEIAERAKNVIDILRVYDIAKFPVAFVCHSYGGLLLKEILRQLSSPSDDKTDDKGNCNILEMTQGIVFLSTPHKGSRLADFFSNLALLRPTSIITELKHGTDELYNLNEAFKKCVLGQRFEINVYYETIPTKARIAPLIAVERIVVDKDSADPEIPFVESIPMDCDHYSICRPADQTDHLYLSVFRFLDKVLQPREVRIRPFLSRISEIYDAKDVYSTAPLDDDGVLEKVRRDRALRRLLSQFAESLETK